MAPQTSPEPAPDLDSTSKISPTRWLGFVTLCLLWSSAWAVEGAWPAALPTPASQALHNLILALVLCPFTWKILTRHQPRPHIKLALASILLLGAPATLARTIAGAPDVITVALFGLLPVAVVTLVAYFDFGATTPLSPNHLLVPALIGATGVLLFLPFAMPNSWRSAAVDSAAIPAMLIAAIASIWMHRLLRDYTLLEAAILCCLANALFFLAVTLALTAINPAQAYPMAAFNVGWPSFATETAKSILFDLPQLLLLLWLMRVLTPAQFSARYLIVPLFTALEGFALLRPEIMLRSLAGIALLLFGAWRLMTTSPQDQEPALVLH